MFPQPNLDGFSDIIQRFPVKASTSERGFFGHEETFIAEFDRTLGIFFRGMPGAITGLSSYLFRCDETRLSPRASLKNRQNEIRRLCDLTAEVPKPWTHLYEDNVTIFVTKALQLPKDFNCETPPS